MKITVNKVLIAAALGTAAYFAYKAYSTPKTVKAEGTTNASGVLSINPDSGACYCTNGTQTTTTGQTACSTFCGGSIASYVPFANKRTR